MDRDDIFRELTKLDLMLVDLQLFLDTHPTNGEALNRYNSILARADQVRALYEKMYGPLYSFRSYNRGAWKWNRDPWPWETCFNFNLPREECR